MNLTAHSVSDIFFKPQSAECKALCDINEILELIANVAGYI
jgi:hypothetical protein